MTIAGLLSRILCSDFCAALTNRATKRKGRKAAGKKNGKPETQDK